MSLVSGGTLDPIGVQAVVAGEAQYRRDLERVNRSTRRAAPKISTRWET